MSLQKDGVRDVGNTSRSPSIGCHDDDNGYHLRDWEEPILRDEGSIEETLEGKEGKPPSKRHCTF